MFKKAHIGYDWICNLWCFHTRARQDDNTNVEPVHFYYAFHTRFVGPGVKGIIEMHRFNICLVIVLSLSCRCLAVVLLWCESTMRIRVTEAQKKN